MDKIKEFSRAVNALALELPETVWVDFNSRWMKLESYLSSEAAREYWEGQGWVRVEDGLPKLEARVLCYHEDSENYFICYRTNDCTTNEEKWWGGAMPTHWKYLTSPNKK